MTSWRQLPLDALLGAVALAAVACQRPTSSVHLAPGVAAPALAVPGAPPGKAVTGVPAAAVPAEPEATPRPLVRCFPDEPAWSNAPLPRLLDRAAVSIERGEPEAALACAEEAGRQAPRSARAHHQRALALLALSRFDDARDALTLALTLAPDDPEMHATAADLYINLLSPSAERSAIGLEHARRGARLLARRGAGRDVRQRRAALALLEGEALTDLGRPGEALARLGSALTLDPANLSIRYQRGLALFELCRFGEAHKAFDDVLTRSPDHPHALFQRSLIDERDGRDEEARRGFAAAHAADPDAFPTPPEVGRARFDALVRDAIRTLPADMRRDLDGIPVEPADLPAVEDLVAEDPPLSPTILGLYRGLPLGTATDDLSTGRRAPRAAAVPTCAVDVPARAIVLYRLNLLRTVRDEPELVRAIGKTLLHEVGHLRGEDDGSLRDRGLE